ncbi:MAG: hypothetical protein EOM10_17335 [Opitutae bacterium]|nr:hypothetical protein [Opitutae bacterium]
MRFCLSQSSSDGVSLCDAEKVAGLIGEVSAASNEQAQGIDQVNIAVAEMDKVVQRNAANAEESASAAEELSSQAQELNGMVAHLRSIVSGSSGVDEGRSYAPVAHARHKPAAHTGNTARTAHKPRLAAHQPAAGKKKNAAKPEEVIPLDDADFSDF